MAYPTTLALITALWSGPGRTKSIALWSGLGGAISALGPLLSGAAAGALLVGSVFLLTLPLAVVALVLALPLRAEPRERDDRSGRQPRRHPLGRARRGAVLAINFAPVPNEGALVLGLAAIALAALVAFILRQRRAQNPLYDLDIAGTADLLGRRLRRHHRLRHADGRDVRRPAVPAERARLLDARGRGCAILPAAVCMVLVAPRSAKLVEAHGARFTLLLGYVFCLLGFLAMLLLWNEGISYWKVGLGYALVGIGVGFAGTPASHSLTGSVPVKRAGMASGTADLQRDLGGAIMQSILGALLTAGYAAAAAAAIAASPNAKQISDSVAEPADEVVRGAEGVAAAVPAVREPDHRRREDVVPRGRRTGRTPPGSSRSCSAPHSCSSASRSRGRGAVARPVSRGGHDTSRRTGGETRASGGAGDSLTAPRARHPRNRCGCFPETPGRAT